ncbi:MAG: glutamine synthetase III [Candidatus Margulisbacteria bacterium]|nr:glutamine synthetase III [Candidatus Margulisiibacteriota bacterium]
MVKTASQIFGELTFSRKVMKEKLSKEVYTKLAATLDGVAPLDETIASDVAHAMKEWAIENGATHFTHWFQPQRGGTAEKHDAFLSYGKDGEMIERFSAKQLIQSEPDASSFPSGGIRSTFEARGYTAWDPTSSAFLLEAGNTKTLVIPTVYLSWTGEVLDLKTPLLRSMKALTDSAIKLQKLLGNTVKKMKVYGGPEQEYFLVSKELYDSRPDLRITGRTLFGAAPAKGQQLEDHYFGSIKDKVMMFMEDFDTELYRHGIPSKTRHNEVSPNQFEIAPLYEEVNLSIDHNLQLMEIIRRVADRHGMVAILYEKPFAGVNGSGKHFNWSLGDDSGTNYLEPDDSPIKNINFLLTLGAILLGVNKFGGLLRAAVADAGNDHRLGANEAPPAIMSVYLGEYLAGLMDEIEGIGNKVNEKSLAHINLGVKNLPKVAKDTSDRNRTSPVAFTGNKFEFRAVGSSQNCSEAATTLNLIVAYGYDEIAKRLSAKKGQNINEKAILVMKDVLKETKPVRFEGNNYSEAWHKEAAKRGLPNAKNTPDALDLMLEKETVELFEKYGVLSKRELHSKVEIKLDAYIKIKDVELKAGLNIARTLILPAVLDQILALGDAVKSTSKTSAMAADLKGASALYADIKDAIKNLEKTIVVCEKEENLEKKAKLYAKNGANALADLRASVDKAETLVADGFWPMAKYQELLTIL